MGHPVLLSHPSDKNNYVARVGHPVFSYRLVESASGAAGPSEKYILGALVPGIKGQAEAYPYQPGPNQGAGPYSSSRVTGARGVQI
jgi:hypothetical protein